MDFKMIDGIECYAPELIADNGFYPAKDFEWLHKIEDANFWFKGRNEILKWLATRHIMEKNDIKVLEIGCGTGGVLKMLSGLGNIELTGAEVSLEYLKFVKRRMPAVKVIQLDATNMPFNDTYDVICAFDVIEHIDDDLLALRNFYSNLKTGGLAFITVPQHKWLWSDDDEKAFHKRRYSRQEMVEKIKKAGFDIVFCSSFVFTLLPVMAISRFFKKKGETPKNNIEFNIFPALNEIFYYFMKLDLILIKLGLRLRAGGSLAVVAIKSK